MRLRLAGGLCLALAAPFHATAQREALHVSVLDPDGKPVAGAMVEVRRYPGRDAGYSNLDLPDARRFHTVFKMPTAREGTTALHVPVAVPHSLHIDVPPFAVVDTRMLFAGEELTVRLQRGATVHGKVVRDDGIVMAGAEVELRHKDRASRAYAKTDANGLFRFERVRPGDIYLEVNAAEGSIPEWQRRQVAAGETAEVDITVAKGASLVGRVLDAETEKPVAGAEIGIGWTFDKRVRSDDAGKFRLAGIGGPYGNQLFVRAPGYQRLCVERPKEKEGEVERDVFLTAAYELRGRILDLDGKPAKNCYVAAVGGARQQGLGQVNWVSARTDANGHYRIRGLHEAFAHVLLVRHELRATIVLPIPEFSDGKSQTMDDVTLRARRIVQGTVMNGDEPVTGLEVKLHGVNADAPAIFRGARPDFLDYYVARRKVLTDTRGRFFFGDVAPGEYRIEADGLSHTLRVKPNRDPEPVRFE